MFDILTLGDATQDIFIKPHELSLICPAGKPREVCPEPFLCLGYGEKIPIDEIHYDIGGSACNTAVAFSNLGLKTAFCGVIGRDSPGREILERLKKRKIRIFAKKIKGIKTSFSVIIDFKGERTILVYRGLSDYSELQIPKISFKWLYVGPLGEKYEKLYIKIIALVSEKGLNLALNPGSLQIEDRKQLFSILRVTRVLILNKEEASELLNYKGVPQILDLLKGLQKMGPQIVAITDARNGAYACFEKEYFHLPAYPAKRVETTGAGDAFSAGFITALIYKKDVKEALQWGVINSASVIEKLGAQEGLLSQNQIERRLFRCPKVSKI